MKRRGRKILKPKSIKSQREKGSKEELNNNRKKEEDKKVTTFFNPTVDPELDTSDHNSLFNLNDSS